MVDKVAKYPRLSNVVKFAVILLTFVDHLCNLHIDRTPMDLMHLNFLNISSDSQELSEHHHFAHHLVLNLPKFVLFLDSN